MAKASMARKIVFVLAAVLVLQLLVGATASAAPPAASCFYYTVRWGDSLSAIAWRFGDNVWNLAARNGIANPNFVRAGQVLRVCGWGGPGPTPGWHTVRWGETLWSIARWYGTTPWPSRR